MTRQTKPWRRRRTPTLTPYGPNHAKRPHALPRRGDPERRQEGERLGQAKDDGDLGGLRSHEHHGDTREGHVREGRKPNRGGQTKRQDRPTNNQGTGVPLQLQGKCFRFGKDGHSTKDCRLPKTIKCNACKKQGHLKVACMSCGSREHPSRESRKPGPYKRNMTAAWETMITSSKSTTSHTPGKGARRPLSSTYD